MKTGVDLHEGDEPKRARIAWTHWLGWLVLPAAIALTTFRRWDQVTHASLWVEEGSQFLHQYLAKGWLYVFEPVNGYMIVPSKLVQLTALHLSFVNLPEWTVGLTLGVSGLVAVAVATAPINMPYKWIAALAPFLVPIDPEPLAVGEYIFWFTGLLSVLALLWKADGRDQWLRCIYSAIGALSSPLAILVAPLMAARAAASRKPWDIAAAGAGIAPVVWQVWLILGAGSLSAGGGDRLSPGSIPVVIEKFAGDYFLNTGGWLSLATGCVALVAVAGLSIWAFVSERRLTPATLFVCFGLSIVASLARAPLDSVDAIGGAPRYFFYPFVLLAWTLIALATGPVYRRAVLMGLALLPVVQIGSPWFVRRHDPLDWKRAAVACVEGRTPEVPQVQTERPSWPVVQGRMSLQGQFANDGVNWDLGFARVAGAVGSASSGDAATGSATFTFDAPQQGWLAVQVLTGPDATGQWLDIVSRGRLSVDLGQLTSQLKSGWAFILLPTVGDVSAVAVRDEGAGWGQWSALGAVLVNAAPPAGTSATYALPVQFDGKRVNRWKVDLTTSQCVRLSREALLDGVR